jgi:hypothetical protein
MPQAPVYAPLGGPTVSGTQVTVDVLANTPTQISAVVRDLVADNQGYFAEEIFATPGFTVQGGAIIYEESFPTDHFLDPAGTIAPRAPGSEAARVALNRFAPKIARPESWAGSIEVTDEQRRRNDVTSVQAAFRKTANTFADRIQSRAIEVLNAFVAAASRDISSVNWGAAFTAGVPNADPTTLPQVTFAAVMKQFAADKAGVLPDLLILNQNDAFNLDVVYGDKLKALLDRYGLKLRVSPQQTAGKALFVKSKQVGVIAFEKPLDTEYTREGTRKTDVYTLESVPVLVANDASAVLRADIDG